MVPDSKPQSEAKAMDSKRPYLIRCTSCRTKNRIPAEKINSRPVCGKCKIPLKIQDAFNNRPVEVTENTFESQIVNSPVPVLAVFWAPWCTACQAVLPAVDRIASNLAGRIKVAKINMEQNPALASRFQVMSVPFMIIFDNGAEKDSMAGAASETDILKKLAPYH